MSNKLHILITSDLGIVRPYTLCKKRLKAWMMAGGIFVVLAVFCSIYFSLQSFHLKNRVETMTTALKSAHKENVDLNAKVAELEFVVEEPLKAALDQLNKRSQVIESILDFVGVDVVEDENQKSQGGPYTQLPEDNLDDIIFRVDSYLDVILPIPLGSPTNGTISSRFGRRIDPFTKKPAFHSGLDIKSDFGSEVKATADGVVLRAQYDGKYGRYVLIDHKNGFKTIYGHNSKILVKAGEKVKRGQAIAQVGSSGRSTGPHVHYEVRYKNKLVDPRPYVRIAAKLAEQKKM
jgi:murein DD-endopeptidase MepM/ murein hydrolase activator NlpD